MFFFNGYFYAAHQMLIHYIVLDHNATNSQMAMMIGALYAGPMLTVLCFGTLSDSIGRRVSGSLAIFCMVLGAFIIAVSPYIYFIVFGFLLYGVGVGGMESSLFAIISDVNKESCGQNLLVSQGLFSIGAMISPMILSNFVKGKEYQVVYICMCLLCIYGIKILRQIPLEKEEKKQKTHISQVFLMLKNPYLVLCMVSIIISTGSESAFTYWSSVYFEAIGKASVSATALSVYWLASILGRFGASKIKNVRKLVVPCFIVASLGSAIFLFVPNICGKLIGIILVGISFAPLYPVLGYQSSVLFPQYKATAFALITFSSNLGGVFYQIVIGKMSNFQVMDIYLGICFLCGGIAVITLFMWFRQKNNEKHVSRVSHVRERSS